MRSKHNEESKFKEILVIGGLLIMCVLVVVFETTCKEDGCYNRRRLPDDQCLVCKKETEKLTEGYENIVNVKYTHTTRNSYKTKVTKPIVSRCFVYDCDERGTLESYYCDKHRCHANNCMEGITNKGYCKDHQFYLNPSTLNAQMKEKKIKKRHTVRGYSDPEELYYDNMNEFYDIDEAEEYYYDMLGY